MNLELDDFLAYVEKWNQEASKDKSKKKEFDRVSETFVDRSHEGCVGCPWEHEEPAKCSGHPKGPTPCRERPDADRFARPGDE